MALTKVSNSMCSSAPVSILDYGADNTGQVDAAAIIQKALNDLAQTGGELVFPTGTYLISTTIILPFGNNGTDKQFTVNFQNSTIKSTVTTPLESTYTGFVSGYWNGSAAVADTTATEGHVAANTIVSNLMMRGFGTGIRLNNFNYGCGLQNVQVENCFHGVNLTRCFYLIIDNMSIRGLGTTATGGVGFKTVQFSNIMPMTGIKVGQCDIGMQLGGFDGGKMASCSAEGCNVGVELYSECSAIYLDTFYLEGNTVAALKLSSVVRRGLITNTWFYGDPTKHFLNTTGNSGYNNITFINTVFYGGVTNTPPIQNLYGAVISCDPNPAGGYSFSGVPNLEKVTSAYEIETSGYGYSGTVRAMDNRGYNGIIPTAYGGRFRVGVLTDNRSPYQTVVNNAGSLEFTTQYATDGFTALLWSVSISHASGTWSRTYLVFYDNDAGSWRLYKPDSAGLTVDTTVTCTDNGGYLKLKAPTFTTPSVIYSVVRTL